MDTTAGRVLTSTEVATLFRVDPKTVTRWAKTGRMPSFRTPTGRLRFLESDVTAVLEAGYRTDPPAV